MIEFQMFRAEAHPFRQGNLFKATKAGSQILEEHIRSLPEATIRSAVWHVGNLANIDERGVYFRFGKTGRKKKGGAFVDGDFVDVEQDDAPSTHVVMDFQFQVCCIAKQSVLAPTTMGIARQLRRLLNRSAEEKGLEATFSLGDVKDPASFLSYIRDAYAVRGFWATYRRANVFDAGDFVGPWKKMVEAAHAESGKTSVKGENLDPEVLEEITHAVASTGDDAGARVQMAKGAKAIPKRLGADHVVLQPDSIEAAGDKMTFLQSIRKVYTAIRGSGE